MQSSQRQLHLSFSCQWRITLKYWLRLHWICRLSSVCWTGHFHNIDSSKYENMSSFHLLVSPWISFYSILKFSNVEVIYFLSWFTSRDCNLWYESQINPFLPSLLSVMVLHHSDDNHNLNTAQYTSVHPTSTEWQFSVEEILWAQSPLRVLIHCPTLYKSQYYLWRTISTCLYK